MTHIDYHELGALLSCGNRVDFFLKRLASSGFVFFYDLPTFSCSTFILWYQDLHKREIRFLGSREIFK